MESLESTLQRTARLSASESSRRGKTERARVPEGPSVCQTPASGWRQTDRRYSVRRPLFTSECSASSKGRQSLPHTEKVAHVDITRKMDHQHVADSNRLSSRLRLEDPVPPLLSKLELSSPLTVPDLSHHLQERPSQSPSFYQRLSSSVREVQPSQSPSSYQRLSSSVLKVQPSQSPSSYQRLSSSVLEVQPSQSPSSFQRLSSSVLEVQRLNPPLRPPLSSTVLHPTYSPRWGPSTASGQTYPRLETRREQTLGSSGGLSKIHSKSPHQENYWTCAVPKGLPPCPDRRSADWDPNAEYEHLLDYTYPLRAGWGAVNQPDNFSQLKQAGPDLQDSGIGLDHTCSSSTSLSVQGLTTTDARNWRTFSVGQRSPDLRAFSESPDCVLSEADRTTWSLDSEDAGKCEHSGRNQTPQTSPLHSSVPVFTSSSSFLLASRRVGAEVDEEFWPLPEQLEELQVLSREVRKVAAQLRRPLPSGQRSPSPKAPFVSSSKPTQRDNAEDGCDNAYQTEDGTSRLYPPGEVKTTVADFSGRTQPESQKNREESDSLLQRIQVFCPHLEELIRQLHAEAARTKPSAVPAAGTRAARTWLDEGQTFDKDLSSDSPTTSSVLNTGQLLLGCINTMSPVLRDTLLLIERRSGVQPPSLLFPVDSLLQSTLVPHGKAGSGLLGVNEQMNLK